MKRIMEFIRPLYRRIAWGLFIKFLGTISELFLPWILSYLIDDVIPLKRVNLILAWGGAMLAASAVCIVGNVVANRNAAAVARDSTRAIRHALYEKITYLSDAQIDAIGVPSLVSRLSTDTYNLHHMVGVVQRMGVRAPILVIGGILMTLTLDVPMTLVLVATVPLIGILVTMVSKKGARIFRELQNAIDGLVRVIRENITGARVIKALSMNDYEIGRFAQQNREVSSREVHANVVMGMGRPIMNTLLYIGQAAVICVGASRVHSGAAEPGSIVAFLSYFTIIANAMMGVTRLFVVLTRSAASANRVSEILDLPEDLTVQALPAPEKSEYHIEFRDVSFSYNKRRPTIEHISFALHRGESLGLIGATGSGKTTIIKLLMRFYDVDEGQILIDGRDVRTIEPEVLHTMFGVAFQNDNVFSDTVRENILLGRKLSDEDVNRAIRDAQAAGYISVLPDGLDEHLNTQGTNLSGGQRQRLLIARALAGKPDVLVLDDSSSALDYRTDADLRRALSRGYSDTTSILVASRVSSIAHCTQILVLDEGKIIGRGSHEQLLATCREYQEIARTQMGGLKSA